MAVACLVHMRGHLLALATLLVLLSGSALDQPSQPAPAPPPEPSARPPTPAEIDAARGLLTFTEVGAPAATMTFYNRPIVEFQATVMGRAPVVRASQAEQALRVRVAAGQSVAVDVRRVEQLWAITVGGTPLFVLVPADAQPDGEPLEAVARRSGSALTKAIGEAAELGSRRQLAFSAGRTVGATLLLLWLLRLIAVGFRRLSKAGPALTQRILQGRPGTEALRRMRAGELLRLMAAMLVFVAVFLLLESWLVFVLNSWPYTRPWGEGLRDVEIAQLSTLAGSVIHGLPGSFTAAVILLGTYLLTRILRQFFSAVEASAVPVLGVEPEAAAMTRRLILVLIWVFAVVMAYPYLPGSHTDAFKAASVFIGLVISLGSGGMAGHLVSGLTIAYSRILKRGDFVRVGDVEGRVHLVGAVSTKVHTARGEEIAIPNGIVMSSITTNYSRMHEGQGVHANTSVTIGYDVPWRQVRALLLLAAERTPGVSPTSPPLVQAVALREASIDYTLTVVVSDAAQRSEVLDRLHANILDAFNEFGVQIMAPQYRVDPLQPKVVPPDRWFAPPSQPRGQRCPDETR